MEKPLPVCNALTGSGFYRASALCDDLPVDLFLAVVVALDNEHDAVSDAED